LIEVEVHNSLLCFLRSRGEARWPHHLTMARLVARALRLGRSALIQTSLPSHYHYSPYRVSYLLPLLMSPTPGLLVIPEALQRHLLEQQIPLLQEWVQIPKPIETGDRWPRDDFAGVLLTTPEAWFQDRLAKGNRFPTGIPTLIDGADNIETWVRQQLTVSLHPGNWNELMEVSVDSRDILREYRVQLTRSLFQRPQNPYECYVLESLQEEILQQLDQTLKPFAHNPDQIPPSWPIFWQSWQQPQQLRWAEISRALGSFSLYSAPLEVSSLLENIWLQQPIVLIGGALDFDSKAPIYRETLGLPDLTCIKFNPDRQSELIQLYLPDGVPMPNTPEFQKVLIQELRTLLCMSASVGGLIVIIAGDVPLKAQLGAILASEFGSRVQVEKTELSENGILVTGWEFWRQHQGNLPTPHLCAIATLPLPSLENPLVAGRVAHYKAQRKDWFRLYLLPWALNELQCAIAPIRESQGVVALFDNRVLHRTYGKQVLSALSPYAKIDYLDTIWLTGNR
jgi:ATP-dependent DNA helicase DinG